MKQTNGSMDNPNRYVCPKCGKELKLDNSGTIGWCSVHKQWFSVLPGSEGFAAAKNEEEAKANQQRLLVEEQEKQQQREKAEQEARASFTRKLVISLVAVCFVAMLVFLFIIRPALAYNDALTASMNMDYERASILFHELGTYKDAEDQARLNDALLLLRTSPAAGIAAIDELAISPELSDPARTRLVEVISNWEEAGLSSETALQLLPLLSILDPSDEADRDGLFVEMHQALLNDGSLDSQTADIDNDGIDELVALTNDYTIECYEMISDGNQRTVIADSMAAEFLVSWGLEYSESNVQSAISCFRSAYSLDTDQATADAFCNVISTYPLSFERIQLRIEALEMYEEGSEGRISCLENLTSDVQTAINRWNELGISPNELLGLVHIANSFSINIENGFSDTQYRETALATAGSNISSYAFTNWDGGYEELITVSRQGDVRYWALEETFKVKYEDQSHLIDGIVSLPSNGSFVLVRDSAGSAFALYTYEEEALSKTYSVSNIQDAVLVDGVIHFGKAIAGSIERVETYEYRLGDASATRLAIEWPITDYPYPSTPEELVIRWLETIYYDLPEERSLLEQVENGNTLSFDFNQDCTRPSTLSGIEVTPYSYYEEGILAKATYETSDKADTELYFSISQHDGECCITGTSYSYSPVIDAKDIAIGTLIPLNGEIDGAGLANGGSSTYRILVPTPSSFHILWQSGTGNSNRTSYQLSLHKDDITNEAIISYDLVSSPLQQQSFPLFLAPGTYLISIRAVADNASGFKFTAYSSPRSAIEMEPNDSTSTATQILPATVYSASLVDRDDIDTFSFTLSEDTGISVLLSSTEDGNRRTRYEATILTEELVPLSTLSMTGQESRTSTGNIYLGPGSYLIAISAGDYFSGNEYSITLNAIPGNNQETEINGDMANADDIALDTRITASFAIQGDCDWYRFTLPCDMLVTPGMTFVPVGIYSRAYTASLLNQNGEIMRWNISGRQNDVRLQTLALPAGEYYLRIDDIAANPAPYSLIINTEKIIKAESEPNNTLSSANILPPSTPVSGSLTSEEDIDYYRFPVESTTTYQLDFNFPEQSEASTIFTLSIEKEGSTLWRQSTRGNSGGLSQAMVIEPGTYYIRIRPSTWNDIVYTLNMSEQKEAT